MIVDQLVTFEEAWTIYPRKVGKQAALKAWKRLNPPPGLAHTIKRSIETHKVTEWKGRDVQYIPHMSTWLNQWRFTELMDVEPSRKKDFDGIPLFTEARCTLCDPPHEWTVSEPYADFSMREMACPMILRLVGR